MTLQEILDSGVEGSACILILIIAYKIYRAKISTESNCFDVFKMKTSNDGNKAIQVPEL